MIDAIKKLSEERKEPEWLLRLRLGAWKKFSSLEMPKGDEWKYTDLSRLDLSSLGFGKSDIKVYADHASEIELSRESFFEEDKFDVLNNACFSETVALHVKEGRFKLDVNVKEWCFAKIFLIADGDVEIEERIRGKGNAFLSCFLLINGRVDYKYHQLIEGNIFNHKKAHVSNDAKFNFSFFESGGELSRLKVESIIGRNSSSFIKGGFIGRGDQHFNIATNSIHKDENSKNDILIKGVLRDRASSAYFGSIVIEKRAQKSDSYLADHILLIDDARANSIPSLKIEANDVRATHGATVSQMDEEQLFYLMSRGIDRKKAEFLAASAFLNEIKEINNEEIKRIIEAKLS